MAFYEINYSKFGTALIEANSEDEAFEYLQQEINYDEAQVDNVREDRPSNICLYDPVSLEPNKNFI